MKNTYLCHDMKLRNIILLILSLLPAISTSAQDWNIRWNAETDLLGGTGEYLPFWSRTGRNGIVPYSSSALVIGGADVEYKAQNGLFFEAGANLVGSVESQNPMHTQRSRGIVDRLYVSGGWKMLRLDVGMVPREKSLGELSISGGDVMWSGNARNIPGINASSDWIYFEKGHWFGVKGNVAHYQMIDNRFVQGAMIHNKEIAVKLALGKNIDFIGGFAHWAQWGGISPLYGEAKITARNFYRIFMAKSGGEDASLSDRLNVLGNHLGREYFRIDWRASDFTMTAQYDKPFEDNSGMHFQNAPDGIWTLKFSFNNRRALVTDVLYEHIRTTWQSGAVHDRPATEEEMAQQDPNHHYYGKVVIGGCDNYFNNSEYRSGWTNYGRIIGMPLILPNKPDADGIVTRIASTRVRGHHVGVQGVIMDSVPYIFKGTYTRNYGNYLQGESSFFASTPWQLSLGLEFEFGRDVTNLPLTLGVGAYGDFGELYQNSVGLTLRFIYNDSRGF